jgi:hypothetical protein
MNRFTATTASETVVAARRSEIWAVLIQPELLVELTPLLRRIEVGVDGSADLWRWHMIKIGALGASVRPVFTERMRFDEGRRIGYTHQPPPGVTEHQGADGYYELSDVPGGTRLSMGLTLQLDLPLSRLARPAVSRVVESTIQRTTERFTAHLIRHLGA